MRKKEMRNAMIHQLNHLSAVDYERKSQQIMDNLIQQPAFQQAETIGITISRYPEVDTHQIIEYAWQAGKTIVVPKCASKTKQMDFRKITSFDQLETVYMDLQEPIIEQTTSYPEQAIDLVIVPGVIFNRRGYRVGFGGGYYDRYLATYTGQTNSLAFHDQIADDIPIEPHDLPVQTILTDIEVINSQEE